MQSSQPEAIKAFFHRRDAENAEVLFV